MDSGRRRIRRSIESLTKNTPICVLTNLARCRGIRFSHDKELTKHDVENLSFDDFCYHLLQTKNYEIENILSWTKRDCSYIARFVNPKGKWKSIQTLKIAFESIKEADEQKPPIITNFGNRTHENPTACDSITLYNYLCRLNYPTHRNMKFVDMVNVYSMIRSPFSILPLSHSINLLHIITNTSDIYLCERDWYKTPIRHDCVPQKAINSNDAFYCELLNGKDYSLANSPLLEHLGVEGAMIKHVRNINHHRLVVGGYFNPLIPDDFYPYKSIITLAEAEDINTSLEYETIFGLLISRSMVENFHFRIQPEVKSSISSVTWEDLTEVDPRSIICYGKMAFTCQEMEKSKMDAYTISDLTHTFQSTHEFLNPIDGTIFPSYAIKKLVYISSAISHCTSVPDDIRQDARDLIKSVHNVNAIRGQFGDQVREWLSTVGKQSKVAFEILLKIGMYMRGWEGDESNYPVKIAPQKDDVKIEIRVADGLREYYCECEKLVMSPNVLPLIRHNGKEFLKSNDHFEGITIGDRLEKVLKGENTSSMASCIRLSSNWIVASAYYYLQLIGHTPSFIIEELSDIG